MTELNLDGLRSPGRRRAPRRPSAVALRAAGYVVLVVCAVGVLMPFFWMLMSSLKSPDEVFTDPIHWLPSVFVWDNYVQIWQHSAILTWIRNTLILSVSVTFLQVLTGSFAAYGFARTRFPGRDLVFLLYLATIAVPWQSYMIPQFVMMAHFHLTDTLYSLMLLQAFGAFGVFLIRQYYLTIPEELAEAARLDGMSEYGIWWRIMLPLSRPALASLTMLTFVTTWNDYLGPLIYLRSSGNYTLQLGLETFVHTLYEANYAWLFAGLVLSVIPIAVIFGLGQRYFIAGIATSGLKG
jgi:multiple sugar transport system permease protein